MVRMYQSHYLERNAGMKMTSAHACGGYTCAMDMTPQRIRSARKAKGWSQAEFAKRIGTDQAHISCLENDVVGGSIDLIPALPVNLTSLRLSSSVMTLLNTGRNIRLLES